MKKLIITGLIFTSLLTLKIPTAHAAEVTLTPVSDLTVKLSQPTTSFNTEPGLDALYDGGTDYFNAPSEVHESFIKFDLATIPANHYITAAKLYLSGYGDSIYGFSDIRLRKVLSNWDDQTTWSTRPLYSEESEATLEVTANQFPESIDITGAVNDWYTGQATNYGLVMRAFGDGDYKTGIYTADDAHASSKEGPNPPRLVIQYATTPPSPTPTPQIENQSATTSTPTPLSSGTGGNDNQSGGSSPQGEIAPVTYAYNVCTPGISNLTAQYTANGARIKFETASDTMARLYYYKVSKVVPPNTPNKYAVNYKDSATELIDRKASKSHQFVPMPLQAGTAYFFTLLSGETQECEHTFITLQSAAVNNGASALSGASTGLRGDGKGEGSPSQNTFTQSLRAVSQAISLVLTGRQELSPVATGGIMVLFLTFFTLGKRSIDTVIAGYKAVLQIPGLIAARAIKNKPRVTWGKVVSSYTLRGVPQAIISIYRADSGHLVDRTSSDRRGLYGFYVDPGTYRVSAQHRAYTFPSILMPYGYQGGPFKVETLDGTVSLDIPMDPAEYASKIFQTIERIGYSNEALRIPCIVAGLTLGVTSIISDTYGISFLLAAAFVYLTVREWKKRKVTVYEIQLIDHENQPVPFAQINFRSSRGAILARKITGKNGRLFVELPMGEYTAEITTLPILERSETKQSSQRVTFKRSYPVQKLLLKI